MGVAWGVCIPAGCPAAAAAAAAAGVVVVVVVAAAAAGVVVVVVVVAVVLRAVFRAPRAFFKTCILDTVAHGSEAEKTVKHSIFATTQF